MYLGKHTKYLHKTLHDIILNVYTYYLKKKVFELCTQTIIILKI